MPEKIKLETQRLYLREMTHGDIPELSAILQDREVMYAYEHAFSDEEVLQWLENQINRYKIHGFGLWAVILKDGGRFIGQCGLTVQSWNGRDVTEVGYLFNREYWHRGYAAEAAIACREYAFGVLGVPEVFSIIRSDNYPSQRTARRNGMSVRGETVKHYYGMDMPHIVFSVRAPDAGAGG